MLGAVVTPFLQALGAPAPVFYDTENAYAGRDTVTKLVNQYFGQAWTPGPVRRPSSTSRQRRGLLVRRPAGRRRPVHGRLQPLVRRDARGGAGQARLPRAVRAVACRRWARWPTSGCRSCPARKARWRSPSAGSWSIRRSATRRAARSPASSAPATSRPPLRSAASLRSGWQSWPAPSAAIRTRPQCPGGTVAGQTNGVEAVTAILALNALAGHLGRERQRLHAHAARRSTRCWRRPRSLVLRRRAGAHRPDAVGRRRRPDGPGQPPARAAPRDTTSSRRSPRCRSSCRSAPSPTKQRLLSDMILPDHNYLESWGYQVGQPGDRPADGDRPAAGGAAAL